MNTYSNPYKGNPHRKSWEKHYNQKIPKGWHIHHIDGNPKNNNPENLMCVSKHVHWCIHLLQGDISYDFIRHSWSNESRKKASITHKQKIKNGNHSTAFRKGHKPTKGFAGKSHTKETLKILSEQRRGDKNVSCRPEIKELRKQKLLTNNPAKRWDVRQKMKNAAAARSAVMCPHCGKEGKVPGMYRYHFDYCKFTSDQLH